MDLVQITPKRPRLPEWARKGPTHFESLNRLKADLRRLNLHTVCESARCPNIHECFHRGAATFMILGNYCTRGCGFCSVPKGSPATRDMRLDPAEPAGVAEMAARMNLRYVVITSVNRDDLDDGGSAHFAETVREVKRALPEARVEVLTPDFCGDMEAVARVLDAGPDVFNHNMETVPRLYRRVRPQADYRQSLDVLAFARRYRADVLTKSGFMVGLGETPDEVRAAAARPARRRCRRRHHRPVSAAHAAQPAGGGVRRAAPVRRVSRLRPLDRIQDGVQRTAGSQFVHGGDGERRSSPQSKLNFALALASGFFLVLIFPRFNLTLLAPVALAPLLVAVMRETRPRRRFLLGYITGLVYWFGVCYWIQFVLAVHGGMGDAGGWALFVLFCLAKAVQMGIFGWLVRRVHASAAWAVPAVAALWVALEISHEYTGFAWLPLGNAGVEMSLPMRLAPFTGVYGLSFVFMMMAAALALAVLRRPRMQLAWLAGAAAADPAAAASGARGDGNEAAVLVQPNYRRPSSGRRSSLDQTERDLAALSLKTALSGAQPVSLLVWPEVPAPFYYYEDPVFRERVNQLARAAQRQLPAGRGGAHAAGRAAEFGRAGFARREPRSRATTRSSWCRSASSCPGRWARWRNTFRPRWAISVRHARWWFRRWARTRSARSSATNPCSRTWCGSSRPTARACWSIFRTTASSARARRASSTCASCACAPPRISAGSCAPPTTASRPVSIRPDACAWRCRPMCRRPRSRDSTFWSTRRSTRGTATGSR